MASIPSAAPLSRSRPLRPPANSSKPLQASSRLTSSSSTTSAATTTSQLPSTVSNVSLFLTNLRLVDLDLHPDWPGINPLTFTSKDIAQGQKKRIQCVEWALYHLFCLWDPEEARNKLQPFFPPLDQVQSLNLRAALLRCLEQAKKTGVLGRDVIIRKTMLDECKGERMEEVLAVFSSAVLKKLVAEQQLNESGHPALAQTLALENRGYSGQTTDLSVLALAHRASLSRHLRHKDAARARFRDFSELLELKQRTLARRREQAKALEAQERATGALDGISDDVKHDIRRTVRNNWSGNEQWMETLLYGDLHSRKDGLLSTPFDRVWRRVQAGRLTALEDQSEGLLQQLDRRVKTQKERLQKWQTFRKEILGESSHHATEGRDFQPSHRPKGIDLGFGAHENLHLGRLSPRKLPGGKAWQLTSEYSDILDSLQEDFAQSNKVAKPTKFLNLHPRGQMVGKYLEKPADEVISEFSELEEEDHGASVSQDEFEKPDHVDLTSRPKREISVDVALEEPMPLMEEKPHGETDLHLVSETIPESKAEPPPSASPPPTRMSRRPTAQRQSTVERLPQTVPEVRPPTSPSPTKTSRRPTTPVSRSPIPRTPSPLRSSPPKAASSEGSPPRPVHASPELVVLPAQSEADQILASMEAVTPSPVKKARHTLSLAERTRLSMVRRNSKGRSLDDDDDELDLSALAIRLPPTVTITGAQPSPQPTQPHDLLPTPTEEPKEHGYEDLVTRTRRSMAGFEASQKKAQIERRRSQRAGSRQMPPSRHKRDGSAYFPSVDEEMGDTTLQLAQELMNNEQDDYEAIFKSRPKIKTSPVGTPVKGWED